MFAYTTDDEAESASVSIHLSQSIAHGDYGPSVTRNDCADVDPLTLVGVPSTGISSDDESYSSGDELDKARRALTLVPIDDPDWLEKARDLADLLRERFQSSGQDALLVECMDVERQICAVYGTHDVAKAPALLYLAFSLWTRFEQTGEESMLMEAIDLEREALSLYPQGHPDRAMSCNNLATSLWRCFQQMGGNSLLAEAIDLNREALSLRPPGHPERSFSCSNLAISLKARFEQTGEESLLTEVIILEREALDLCPYGDSDRLIACNNLANSLGARFEQTGEESLLTEAINLERESLSLQPQNHPLRPSSCNNLASSLRRRYQQTGEESLFIEAINLDREALSRRPSGHPDRPSSCNNLAGSLRTRFNQTGDESLLIEAIDLNEEALESQPERHPSRWRPIISLVDIYLDHRFSQRNLVYAVNYLRQALSLYADDWPSLLSQVAYLTSLIDLSDAPQDFLPRFLQCFSAVIDLASRVAGFVLDQESQLRYLSNCQHIGPRAYWCGIKCGEPAIGLELLERARAMMWTQLLHMRNPELSDAPPDLASELEVLLSSMNASRVLKAPVSSPSDIPSTSRQLLSTEQDTIHRNGARIHELIQQIRAIPGHERFMRGLPFEALSSCAARNAVAVLIATEGECHALIIQPNVPGPQTLRLHDITPEEITQMSISESAPQMRGRIWGDAEEHRIGMKVASSGARSSRVLRKLWTAVVKPVIDHLQLQKASGLLRPRLHWCPTGVFMFLPLHAAGIYDIGQEDCCSDYIVSSYTSTLTALLRAQESSPSFSKLDTTLGLIAAMKAQDANLPVLWNVEDEMDYVQGAANAANIVINADCAHGATVAQVTEAFKRASLVHIACHGIQDTDSALSSGFCLVDGNLTLSHLMELDLKNAFFAFLSACETAKGDHTQPDQTVHLAAAMLFIGFRSVVATMWAMNDADGPQVAKLFYERLFAEDEITLDAIPYALDYAVTELRKSGVPPERWATFIHMGA